MIYTKDTIIGEVTTYESFEGEVSEIIELLKEINKEKDKPATIVQEIQLDPKKVADTMKEVARRVAAEI